MGDNKCFIEPEFAGRKQRKKIPPKEQEDTYYDDESPKKEGKTFMDTIREHKILIMTFAIVIILLICVIVWLISGNGKDLPVKKEPKSPPVNRPGTNAPNPVAVVTPPVQENPTEQPTIPEPVQKNQKTAQHPINHDQILKTVDDEELNRYMNSKDDEVDELNELDEEDVVEED